MRTRCLLTFLIPAIIMLLVVSLGVNNAFSSANVETKTQKEDGQHNVDTKLNSVECANSVSYEIVKETYIENSIFNNISISYPQIIISDDRDRQLKINEILKKEALQYVDSTRDNDEKFSLALEYKITWKSERLLSIQYSGVGYVQGEPHPNSFFYTTNINISNGNKLRLQDIVNIDEKFVMRYRDEQLKSLRTSKINGKQVFVTNFGTGNKTLDDTMELFKRADSLYPKSWGIYCYFTPEAFGISASVPHALGDHVEFEINYKDIADHVKVENEIWKDFFD